MKKIKITTKLVKKVVLWTLLAALVVGLGIIIIDSYSRDNILSNNSPLQSLDYSGKYRSYIEKQLISKNYASDYDTIISEEITKEKNRITEEQDKKLDDLLVEYETNVKNENETYTSKNQELEDEKQEKLQEIEDNDSLTASEKTKQKDTITSEYNTRIETLKTNHETTLSDLSKKYESDKQNIESSYAEDYNAVNENDIRESIVTNILNGKTLTEAINDKDSTPDGYVFSLDEAKNSAIKATFDYSATEAANTINGARIDSQAGQTFKVEGSDIEYVYSAKSGKLVYTVDVPVSGYYNILLDYIPYSNTKDMKASNSSITEESGGATIERAIYVDGKIPFDDVANVSFVRTWGDGGSKFIDAKGNEIKPTQVEIPQRNQAYVRDSVGYVTEPYLIYFSKGNHTIEIEAIRENMGIANVYLTSKEEYQSYEQYKETYKNEPVASGKIAYNIQGEGGDSIYYENGKEKSVFQTNVVRTSSTIYGASDRTSAYNSYIKDGEEQTASPVKIILNTIGGSKWSSPGDWISWNVNIKEAGLYKISLRAKQNVSRGLFSSRKLSIDGAVPFSEAMNCKFVYSSDWNIVTLGNQDGEAYYFYLSEGNHTISLEVTLGDYATQINRVQGVIDDLNALYRKIIQKTGINPDPYMDYFKNASGKKLIAQAQATFQECCDTLYDVSEQITKISGEKSSETASLETLAVQLQQFIKDYRKIQKNLSDFSTNISSLGTWILNVSQQALTIDYLIVHSDDYDLPRANPSFFGKAWFGIKGFFGSFFFDYESVGLNEENVDWKTIEVWLCTSESQGREQANAISAMISAAMEDPTSTIYGINVKLKVVSSDVLLTATLAGRGPDIAINVGNGTPVNYALRGATYDLTTFTTENLTNYFGASRVQSQNIHSFQDIALSDTLETNGGLRRFQYSAMVPYEFEGGYYALPYTQSYLMMFYRTDMFEEYGWEVPETWSDVIQLIPELQIMNFQFYLPLNTSGASSVVNQIFASYLYQNVEDTSSAFYRTSTNEFGESYIESNFDSEEAKQAFEFWCSFYTDYKFPLSASFVNRFRSGETPIGIVGYDMYNTLAVSAPEIRGKWSFALLPGTEKTDDAGNTYIDHSGAASGMSLIMMSKTKNPYESWAFMDWFTSADTQVSYAREIEAILGAAARHNTANVYAFTRLAWTEAEKSVLMDQWEETVGVPETAGGYYTGRNLENAFREVVNNNYNPRQILADYILTINGEIDRKREEFGLPSSKSQGKNK